jgi:hypothetical protein
MVSEDRMRCYLRPSAESPVMESTVGDPLVYAAAELRKTKYTAPIKHPAAHR